MAHADEYPAGTIAETPRGAQLSGCSTPAHGKIMASGRARWGAAAQCSHEHASKIAVRGPIRHGVERRRVIASRPRSLPTGDERFLIVPNAANTTRYAFTAARDDVVSALDDGSDRRPGPPFARGVDVCGRGSTTYTSESAWG
jgi:hypothetical protein